MLGLASLGAGAFAVFDTHLEAGPVALLALGLILILITMAGRLPSRLKAGDFEAAFEEKVSDFVETAISEATPEARPRLVEALEPIAEVLPRGALSAANSYIYENMINGIIFSIISGQMSALGRPITYDAKQRDYDDFDGLLQSDNAVVPVVIKYGTRDLGAAFLVGARKWQSQVESTRLIISRMPLSRQAVEVLERYPDMYVAVIANVRDSDRLESAIEAALDRTTATRYFGP